MNVTKEAYNTNVATFLKKLQVIGYDWLIDHIYIQDSNISDFKFLVDIHFKTTEQLDDVVNKLFINICKYNVESCDDVYVIEYSEKKEENQVDLEILLKNKIGFNIFIIANGPLACDANIPARILLET